MSEDVARALLHHHADRHLAGRLTDGADAAAVVAVERLALALGTDEPAALRTALDQDPPAVAEVVEQLAAVLGHRSPGRGPDSGDLNAGAGHHEVTPDAGLLRTAVRAAAATYDAVPYYAARYGGRGARFAGSDSAWLVSLAHPAQPDPVGQVRWLSGVLAGRGMPSWLLERHLDNLVGALLREHGPGAAGGLPAARDDLAVRRRGVVDDDLLDDADRWVDAAVGEQSPVARAGALLAAALADVGTGLLGSDRALVDWLVDPVRCPPADAGALLGVRARVAEEAGMALPPR